MKHLGRFSIGLGDRFGHQGNAQLRAIIKASQTGADITPVWNKSNREHIITGTEPQDVRNEADTVTRILGFSRPYFVDADHINLDTVDPFIEYSDFFTIDVASYIGKIASVNEINEFISAASRYKGELKIAGPENKLKITTEIIKQVAEKYLFAAIRAWQIYRKIEKIKGRGNFITEISMDEVTSPQSPAELFLILKMLALEDIPVQTFAPRFTGRFLKGIDYIGDPALFARDFELDLMIINYAVQEFGLPEDLKISIHSGSDKFSIYPFIGSILGKTGFGMHLKTAGTTWLEEVTGLAQVGGEALDFLKNLYYQSLDCIDELCAPYSDVIDISVSSLPSKNEVRGWSSEDMTNALRHIPENRTYNKDLRQLFHVAYKIAAINGEEYFRLLEDHKDLISQGVFENIYERHLCRLFELKV